MAQNNGTEQMEGTQKLQNDLDAVMERVQLCREIMLESPGIEHDETLGGVIGFLEACRDRMAELIEAGTQGELSEELFERCLTVNDAVCRTLDAERTGTKLSVKDGGSGTDSKTQDSSKPLLDLGNDNEDEELDAQRPVRKATTQSVGSPPQKSFSKPKAAQEDSLLAPYMPAPAPTAGAPVADPFAAPAASAADPFAGGADSFADFDVAPPAPPVAAVVTSSAAPVAGAEAVSDLEALLAGTSVSPPPVPAVATASVDSAQAQAAAEFDAFLDSLGETKK